MKSRYVSIEGNIGAGKTSLSQLYADHSGSHLFLEKYIENPFLPMFYKEPQRFAFSVETSFLAERYHTFQKDFLDCQAQNLNIVADYSFYKSLIFAKVNLSGEEWALFKDLFYIINKQIAQPNLFVYLENSTEKLLKNINQRGRDYESKISIEYLEQINNGYLNFMDNASGLRCLVLNTENVDFVKDADVAAEICKLIDSDYKYGITRIQL